MLTEKQVDDFMRGVPITLGSAQVYLLTDQRLVVNQRDKSMVVTLAQDEWTPLAELLIGVQTHQMADAAKEIMQRIFGPVDSLRSLDNVWIPHPMHPIPMVMMASATEVNPGNIAQAFHDTFQGVVGMAIQGLQAMFPPPVAPVQVPQIEQHSSGTEVIDVVPEQVHPEKKRVRENHRCVFWGELDDDELEHPDCDVILTEQAASKQSCMTCVAPGPYPKVCPCECSTCKRAWWKAGRPKVRDGVIIRDEREDDTGR